MNELCLMTNLSSGDVAAWAQAVVSTVAIGVGAGALVWQVKRQRQDALHTAWQAKFDLASSAGMLLAEAKTKLEVVKMKLHDTRAVHEHVKSDEYEAENWQGLVDELAVLDLQPLSRPHISMRLRQARREVERVHADLEGIAEAPQVMVSISLWTFQGKVVKAIGAVDSAIDALAKVIDELASRLAHAG